MRRYYDPDYPRGKVFLLLTKEEEEALDKSGLLRTGEEAFRESGYVVYRYEKNKDFLEAAQEVFS